MINIDNFTYFSPTKIVFGSQDVSDPGRVDSGSLVREFGGSRVLVLHGDSSERSGLLDAVIQSLNDTGIESYRFGGIRPNPRLSRVYQAIEAGREYGADFLLAVGGGSVIDTAKATAYGMANSDDVWDYFEKKKEPAAALPIGVVLTISAAGSETSNSAVITNDNGMLKRGYRNDLSRPKFALLDPALTMSLPWYQTACGCVDIVMHATERFFTRESPAQVRDGMSTALIRAVMRNGLRLKTKPDDYDARAEVMWAGALAHNDLFGDRHTGDWACHQLEHELSGMFDVPHGAGLAAIWGAWARYVYRSDVERFAAFAVSVFDVYSDFTDLESTAIAGIESMEEWFRRMEMPTRVSDLEIGLTDGRIDTLAEKCSFNGTRTIGAVQELDEDDIRAIYRAAR